ncbi:hypothetical protein GOODEAATRI_018304 [Goodea atripinnis]|uniref:Uncharacterized protein n=1 Tax=Goodea atripinnis TaxID=208336 RepID=A0ABV0MW52_9TELE
MSNGDRPAIISNINTPSAHQSTLNPERRTLSQTLLQKQKDRRSEMSEPTRLHVLFTKVHRGIISSHVNATVTPCTCRSLNVVLLSLSISEMVLEALQRREWNRTGKYLLFVVNLILTLCVSRCACVTPMP